MTPILIAPSENAETMRRQVWLAAWLTAANNNGLQYAKGWADGAVRDFDAKFSVPSQITERKP